MDSILLSRDATTSPHATRRSLLASTESLRDARRVIADQLQRISPRLPREQMSRAFIRELAFSRARTLRSALRDRVLRGLPFLDVFDGVCDALVGNGLLKAEPATHLLRGDLLSASTDDGRSIFTPDGWCEVSEALWIMLDALPYEFEDHDVAVARIGRALQEYDVAGGADDLIAQGWEWLTREGLLRCTLESDFGDPRPVVYFICDDAYDLDGPGVAERMRAWSSELFADNPYRPHLVVVLERRVDESDIEALLWRVRRTQLVGFDTSSIVWDLTSDPRSVDTLKGVGERMRMSAKRAKVETQVLMRGHDSTTMSGAQVAAQVLNSELLVVAAPDATLAELTHLQQGRATCEIVAAEQKDALRWLEQSSETDDSAIAMRAILASKECRMGDTFTIRGDRVQPGCPLGCAGADVADLEALRARIAARFQGESGQASITSRPNRGGRRRCI